MGNVLLAGRKAQLPVQIPNPKPKKLHSYLILGVEKIDGNPVLSRNVLFQIFQKICKKLERTKNRFTWNNHNKTSTTDIVHIYWILSHCNNAIRHIKDHKNHSQIISYHSKCTLKYIINRCMTNNTSSFVPRIVPRK